MINKQQKPSITALEDRYQRAQHLMQGILSKTVAFNTTVYPTWIDDSDYFWYARESQNGQCYRLVNAQTATNDPAFDHKELAVELASAANKNANDVDANNLPITEVEMALDTDSSSQNAITRVCFTAFDQRWSFDQATQACAALGDELSFDAGVVSPDGRQLAFTKNFNLWVRDLETGDERALTRDGEEEFVYGLAGSAWGYTMEPSVQARWSNDSATLFTVQRDTRQVKDLPVVHHVPLDGSIRPTVTHFKMAYPGDEHIETLRLVSIDVESGRLQAANYRQIPTTRNSYGFFTAKLGWWSVDNRTAYFVDLERDYKTVRVVEFNTQTGATRVLFEETTNTQINLMNNDDERPVLIPLPETNELIWFSERSGWGHLYLYNLETGALKNTITQGNWLIRHIAKVDISRRELFIQTAGRSPDKDPYYQDLCRVHLDTGELTTLVSSDHEIKVAVQTEMHTMAMGMIRDVSNTCGVSPSGNFAVVTQSRADTVPLSFLLDREGQHIMDLETADVSGLPNGWQWPEPVKLLAADGETDIYGLVFRPSTFSAEQRYPVVSHVFSTPELPWVSKGSFTNGSSTYGWSYLDAAALAELGFIVVQIDGRGTPFRSKAFHDEHYGQVGTVSHLDDHVAGIQQLAERYPSMDLQRVGITNHTSGGPGGIQGLLEYPDFYKVGIGSTPHDSRLLPASMWGEKYEDLSGPATDFVYPEMMVDKLQGKLLLINGMLDTSCPPAIVFRMIEALQKANKDFDLLLLPVMGHSSSGYIIRRAWDHLVKHLQEVDPPKEFKLTSWIESF